ncbi:unnamed protein product [Allacma fusca]|uniref:Dienelactone hydrolase domain-containing protein n=1 Tax=Allacma fusca TaxID=39272 RepID=A0A8J2K8G0_9HEXA|nr:unnamed protein product [Allacma fusca]
MLVISGVLLFIGSFPSATEGNQLTERVLVGEFPKDCTQTKPVSSDYAGGGKIWNLEDLPIYETAGGNNRVLLLAYDIFGFHPNTFRVADRLAMESGMRVVIPDFFRGEPFPEDKYPIKELVQIL